MLALNKHKVFQASTTEQGSNYIIKDSLLWRNFTKAARNLNVWEIMFQRESVRLNLFGWVSRSMRETWESGVLFERSLDENYVCLLIFKSITEIIMKKNRESLFGFGGRSTLETFEWILKHVLGSITWSLFTLIASNLAEWLLSTWSLITIIIIIIIIIVIMIMIMIMIIILYFYSAIPIAFQKRFTMILKA